MRWHVFCVACVCSVLIGCETTKLRSREVNSRIIESVSDMGIKNAILTQQTIYPYHFVVNGESLNELGEREMDVLASHYKKYPGNLNVRQGRTSPELYKMRVSHVVDVLAKAGIDMERIHIADGMPGGDGMPSDQVLTIIQGRNSPTKPLYYQQGGNGSEKGNGNSNGIGAALRSLAQ